MTQEVAHTLSHHAQHILLGEEGREHVQSGGIFLPKVTIPVMELFLDLPVHLPAHRKQGVES